MMMIQRILLLFCSYKLIRINLYKIMSQQKYLPSYKNNHHLNPHYIMDRIQNQNAKVKLLINSYRDRTYRDEELLANDSDLSKNQILSQNRSYHMQNSRHRLKRHSFQPDKQLLKKQFKGDELLQNKKTKNNFFKHNQQLNKYYEKLSPLTKNLNSKNTQNPQISSRVQKHFEPMRSHKQMDSKKRISIFRVKSKLDDQNGLKKQKPSKPFSKQKKKVQFREHQHIQIDAIDIKILTSHINTLQFLQQTSAPQTIFIFFQSIYDALRVNKISEPVIKRYKNCVYYGEKATQNNTLYQGMIWYYKESFYLGELSDGKKHGKGIQIKFQNGQPSVWRGKFIFGHKNGYFEVQTLEYRYYGKLKDGQFDGQGHLITPNSEYKGLFCEGMKEGTGWQKYTNKSQYRGQYFNNKYDGQGELKAPTYYYKGLFKKGRPDGFGFQRTKQFEYLGNFVMGKKQGKGKLKTKDGTYLQCQFKNGLIVQQSKQIQSPKQIVLDHYLSKQLHALDQQSEEGTLQNMLNQINNSNVKISQVYS